jgi:hypothetical protein
MSSHYQPYPETSNTQHSGLGIIPETIYQPKTPINKPTHAPAVDVSVSMLMIEGIDNDGIRTSDSEGRRLLLHTGGEQSRSLRPQTGFHAPNGNEGVTVCDLYSGSDARESSSSDERGAHRGLAFFGILLLGAAAIFHWAVR